MTYKFPILLYIVLMTAFKLTAQEKPLRLGVVGLTHGHVGWILGREGQSDVQMVGIVETNRDLAQRLSKAHGFPMDMVYGTIEEMVAATQPEAVAAFGNIYDHLAVVEGCAPKGIHVMVEKTDGGQSGATPKKMQALAKKHNIHLLTNYETSWYPTQPQSV